MTAREMFAELGYELAAEGTYAEDKILPYRCYKKNVEIGFFLKEKQFVKAKGVIDCVAIKESELKAINQQCKELGWLEDEKQEIKRETNYEHFEDEIKDTKFDFAVRNGKVVQCKNCPCDECFFNDSSITCDVMRVKWSLQRHVEKVELIQFEYDLLRTNNMSHDRKLSSFATYKGLKEIGYFKDIDFDLTIDEILNNCEVVG